MKSVATLFSVRKAFLYTYSFIPSAAAFIVFMFFLFCAMVTFCAIIYMAANFKASDATSKAAIPSCVLCSDVECILTKNLSQKMKKKLRLNQILT